MKSETINISESLGETLTQEKLTIAAAESCTGGMVINNLTHVPGSSKYVLGGIIAYSNQVKVEQLRVNQHDIQEFGAVSKPVVLQMARQVASLMQADIGISTTGIAGPGGGSTQKPVGTVWMGYWSTSKHFALKAALDGSRLQIKRRTTDIVLEMVRRSVLNIDDMPKNLKPNGENE